MECLWNKHDEKRKNLFFFQPNDSESLGSLSIRIFLLLPFKFVPSNKANKIDKFVRVETVMDLKAIPIEGWWLCCDQSIYSTYMRQIKSRELISMKRWKNSPPHIYEDDGLSLDQRALMMILKFLHWVKKNVRFPHSKALLNVRRNKFHVATHKTHTTRHNILFKY